MPWLDLAQAEREDFAAFLESLTAEQWEAPTLCDRWNVRQVAAHAISFDELTFVNWPGASSKVCW